METIRRDIEPHVIGKTITSLKITEARLVRRSASAEAVTTAVENRQILQLRRRGKYLLFMLDPDTAGTAGDPVEGNQNSPALVLHLGMSGQIIWLAAGAPQVPLPIDDRHVHLRMTLSSGGLLLLRDPRMFGEVFYTADFESTVRLGYEPLADEFTPEMLRRALMSRAPVKSALLNQRRIAGIGNIYADEALFLAGIHPLREAASLSMDEATRLHWSIRTVLNEAITHRGSTIGDYRDAFGAAGSMQSRHQVYGNTENCFRCGTAIKRIKIAGRSTYYCPVCQPEKKISP